ncbi:hypothetical protein ACJQWK_03934 [Exserohilum turcicum]
MSIDPASSRRRVWGRCSQTLQPIWPRDFTSLNDYCYQIVSGYTRKADKHTRHLRQSLPSKNPPDAAIRCQWTLPISPFGALVALRASTSDADLHHAPASTTVAASSSIAISLAVT